MKAKVIGTCALAMLALAAGCSESRQSVDSPSAAKTAPVVVAPTPVRLTTADLQGLRWIEGTWRGTGAGQQPFYERYIFANDSTLDVVAFTDSTLRVTTDTSRYMLRDGHFGNSGKSEWQAVQLRDGAITFAPIRGAHNSFVWRPVSKDEWAADLDRPAVEANGATTPARKWSYQMRRWSAP